MLEKTAGCLKIKIETEVASRQIGSSLILNFDLSLFVSLVAA
jgi:hypothetical protein